MSALILSPEIPWIYWARVLIAASNFLVHEWLLVVIGFAVAAAAFAAALRCTAIRFFFDRLLLRVPVAGSLFKNYHLTNMCRTLGLLLKGHVRVIESITVATEVSTNLLYQQELNNLRHAVTKGSNMAKYLEKKPRLFPPMLTEMIAIGEATGNLSETLLYVAHMYEQELDEQTKRLSSVIEPAMMILMGLLVGFIAISIITPIYEVTQHLQP